MLTSTYNPDVKWQRMKCSRCSKFRWCCQHHIMRRQNSDEVVWICSNGYTNVVYPDACHQWIEDHIKEAKAEGYYKEIDGVYRKKSSSPSKWIIKK